MPFLYHHGHLVIDRSHAGITRSHTKTTLFYMPARNQLRIHLQASTAATLTHYLSTHNHHPPGPLPAFPPSPTTPHTTLQLSQSDQAVCQLKRATAQQPYPAHPSFSSFIAGSGSGIGSGRIDEGSDSLVVCKPAWRRDSRAAGKNSELQPSEVAT